MTDHSSFFARPAPWAPSDLNEATRLSLTSIAASTRAQAVVERLVDLVAAQERSGGRKNQRRAAGLEKLSNALGAVLGGVLRPWSRPTPRWVYHLVGRSAFTGERIGARQFQAAISGLKAANLIEVVPGFSTTDDFDGGDPILRFGRATRFRPTAALLDLVEAHGITPQGIVEDFLDVFPEEPPSVPDPVILRPLKPPRRKGMQKPPVAPLRLDPDDDYVRHFVGEVNSFNKFASNFDVRGCRPPRWYRTFTEDFQHGGRWIAAGNEGNYQRLPQSQRLMITIDGSEVVSLDVSASHLSIMLGLAGLPLPSGDPYALGGLPRAVMKHLVVVTAGKGALPSRWPSDTPPDITETPIEDAAAALVAAYPFMDEPWRLVPFDGDPKRGRRLFVHRLMEIEARAITFAMVLLRHEGILALPVHDELIVRADATEAGRAMLARGYRTAAKIEPLIKETRRADEGSL